MSIFDCRFRQLRWVGVAINALLLVMLLQHAPSFADSEAPPSSTTTHVHKKSKEGGFVSPSEPVPVVIWGREIAVFRAGFGEISAAARAKRVGEHIRNIPMAAAGYRIEAVKASEGRLKGAWIMVNGERIFGVLENDVDAERGESFDNYLAAVTSHLQQWLDLRSEQYQWKNLANNILVALVATLVFLGALGVVAYLSRRWQRRREAAAQDPSRHLKIREVNVRPYIIALEIGFYRLLLWGTGFFLAYLWLTYVLQVFPYSRAWGERLRSFLLDLFSTFGTAALHAVPNLFTVFVIILIARFVARLADAFFQSAERGYIQSSWIEPETARATRRLVGVLIWVFALVVAYPYIPGSGTDAFKGISVFVGLMVSLGSAGIVGQVVGGFVVVYTRAFRPGDHVRVGEYEGIVRAVGVLSTKLETRTREEVTIPNAVMLAATIVNYSRIAQEKGGAIATTTVTIGYDAPWRQVHGMLKMAAERTAKVLKEPAPFVMQRALSDFYPEYTLVIFVQRSEERYIVLSELHGHIQDVFNEHGVQIMSPNFEAQPDQPVLSVRGDWDGGASAPVKGSA